MNAYSISALVGAVVAFALGVAVFLRDRKHLPFVHFTALCCDLCLWQAATFLWRATDSDGFRWLAYLFATPLPLMAMRFFQLFLAEDPRHPPPPNRSLVIVTAIVLAVLGYSAVFIPIHRTPLFPYAFVAYAFMAFALPINFIASRYRTARSPAERLRVLYLLVGAIAAAIGTLIPSAGTVVIIAYLYFLSQSLFRFRLLDLNELLGRMVVLAVLLLTLAAVYEILLAWVRPDQAGLFFFNTIIASFVILILFDPLRTLVEDVVNRWMFRQKFELRLRVEHLRRELTSVIDIGELVERVLQGLEQSSRTTHVSVYLLDRQGGGYDLIGAIGPRPEEHFDIATRRPFFDRLRRDGLIAHETLERERQMLAEGDARTAEIEDVLRAMNAMHASLCLPLQSDKHVLGLLCLRDERLREAYSTAEIELLRGLAAQIAITLGNSQAYEQMRERERLAALGVMAAGLAHEIRNPLGAIKGAAQLLVAKPGNGEPGEANALTAGSLTRPNDEFLGIIVEEVNRLNRVVSQFLDYARPDRGERQAVDVNEEVRKSTQLLQKEAAGRVQIKLELEDSLPLVRFDPEQMRQVFLNLGLNAIQALDEKGGRLTIATRLRRGARRGEPASLMEIRFRDNGPGIAHDALRNIFNPFFTTKEKGTGLGLAISQRILESHGGIIQVRSQPGEGATFTLLMPLHEEATARHLPPVPGPTPPPPPLPKM